MQMNVKRIKISLIILFILVLSIYFSSFSSCLAQTEETTSPKIKLSIEINDLNTLQKQAQIKINSTLYNVPINERYFNIIFSGVEPLSINCSQVGRNGEYWTYQGESEFIPWLIEGIGEQFPFDSYTLNLSNLEIQSFEYNWTFSSEGHEVYFSGINSYSLVDNWKTDVDNQLPINAESKKFVISIQRSYESTFLLFLQVIAPVMACYYLIGSSLILNPKDLGERLRIYIAVFFFVPTYLLSIQALLPHRSAISFPELLLINLLISTAIFSVFGVIAKRRLTDLPRYWRLQSVKYRLTGYGI